MSYADFILDRPIGRIRGKGERDGVIRGGSQRGLAFSLEWLGDRLEGELSFSVANEQVWSTAGNILLEDLWNSFLAGLAKAWNHILLEETYPRHVSPDAPSQAPRMIEAFLYGSDAGRREADAFRARHDVSAWIAPHRALPALWLMREGNLMLLETGGRVVRWAYSDVVRTLRELGDHIAKRAEVAGVATEAKELWHCKDDSSVATLESISMGEDGARLAKVLGPFRRRSRAEVFRGADEIRAAARMLNARVPDQVLLTILDQIRTSPRHEAPVLRHWSERALIELDLVRSDSPRIQGRHIAQWLRTELDNKENRVNPESLLLDWGVTVTSFPTVRQIEAISFWGPNHGPAIIKNPDSRRSGNWVHSSSHFGGQRFTLAHELAHLLVDVDGALPVAEVLGGRLPKAPEERANAFAAEFLLPEEVAGLTYQRSSGSDEALITLTQRFGVTKTLAAYQILKKFGENGSVLSASEDAALQAIVRPRRRG